MRSGKQVAALAGVDVLTIPPKAAAEYLEMDISKHQLDRHTAHELQVRLDTSKAVETSELNRLWDIDAAFMAFVEDAVSQAEQMTSGRELVDLSSGTT